MAIKRVENDAYEIKHLKVDVEVGDRKTPGFKPKLKMKRWDGECSLDIDFADEVEEEELEEELDGEGNITKIKWKIKTATSELELEYEKDGHIVRQLEDGGLELGIVLNKKPLVNTFRFPIQIKGLRYAYQPPLTQEEIDKGAFRPENVVGSYAVYHATRTNMQSSPEDAEKYKTGKAFHIYRPHLVDAVGSEAWAGLDISDGILTITLPQEFLDKAIYPVNIDPDFGYTSIGGTYWAIAGAMFSHRRGSAWTMPAPGGTANWIKAYIKGDVVCDCKVLINQKDSGGAGTHGQIVGSVENLNCIVAAHWEEFTLGGEVLVQGTVYILNILGDNNDMGGGEQYYLAFDETGATAVASYEEPGGSYAAPENPWVVDPEGTTKDYSIYCNYSEEAPPVPANPLIGKPLISPDIIKKAKIR